MRPGKVTAAFFRHAFFIFTAAGACLSLPAAAAGERFPSPGGSSILMDFSPPFAEKWAAAPPENFAEAVIPRLAGTGWEWAADPGTWEEATVLGPLVRPEPPTEFRAFYTDDALFFRARNRFDPEQPPRAQMHGRNRYPSGEDLVEIRLRLPDKPAGQSRYRPETEENPLYHFIINQAGSIYDARAGDTSYDAHWDSLVETEEDAWTLLVTIPFAALELDGPVPALEINIGRDGSGIGLLSWGPMWGETENRRLVLEDVPAEAHPEPGEEEAVPGDDFPGTDGARSGQGIALEWTTGYARPQDRWIEGRIVLDEAFGDGNTELELSLLPPAAGALGGLSHTAGGRRARRPVPGRGMAALRGRAVPRRPALGSVRLAG